MSKEWARRYPDAPVPFLTQTYRDPALQAQLVAEGKSKAQPGQSLHNFAPALAFDVAFAVNIVNGKPTMLTWDFVWFERWGELAESLGLVWGGRWQHLVDGPHVQMPMTWQDAKAGRIPSLPNLPSTQRVSSVIIKGDFDVVEDDGALVVTSR